MSGHFSKHSKRRTAKIPSIARKGCFVTTNPTVTAPTTVIRITQNSLRSTAEGLSIVEALGRCDAWIDKYGGHEMAAGLTMHEENFGAFSEAFRKAAHELLSEDDLQPRLAIDHELAFSELNFDLLQWHEMLQPFGNGNPQPLFFARKVEPVVAPRVVGDKHLIFRLRQRNYHQRAVYFDAASARLPQTPWDIAFRIRSDEYEGETRLEIQIQALRKAEPIE